MEDPRMIAYGDETQRVIDATLQAASELREQTARSRQTIAESREILQRIATSSAARLSSETSDS